MADYAVFFSGGLMSKSIRHNFLMNIILTSSSFIFPLITFPYIQRVLGPDGTGKVSFASSIAAYFWLIAYLGIPTYGVRSCAKVRDNKEDLSRLVQELLCISLIMTAVAYLVFVLVIESVPRFQSDKWLYYIISLEFFFYTIGIEWMFRGLELYTYISVTSILCKIVAVIAMFALIHSKDDYLIYAGLTIFASSASYCINFFYSRKFIRLKPDGRLNLLQHIKPIMVFTAMSCATMVYLHLDVAMLGFMKTNVDVGYYNAAVKIKVMLVSVVTSLGHVLLPRSSYYVEHGRMDDFNRLVQRGLEFVLIVAAPLVVFFILFAKQGILLLSGEAYLNSVHPMQIIMPTVLFIGLSNLLGIQMLVPLGREKTVLYSEIAGALTDFVLNLLLIPRYAAAGAAFGTVMAEFVVLVIQSIALKETLKSIIPKLPYKVVLLSLLAALVVSMGVFPITTLLADHVPYWFQSLITLVIAAALFFSVYGGLLLAFKEPLVMEVWNSIFKRRRRSNV